MLLDTRETAFLMVFAVVFGAYCAWRFIVSFLAPERHQKYMGMYGRFFENWPLGVGTYWTSRFHVRLVRVIFALGFIGSLGLLLYLLLVVF